ncbi:MAG: lysophospholipid acyltransferase family protein [bacterium]
MPEQAKNRLREGWLVCRMGLEIALVRLVGMVLPRLPRRVIVGLARVLGRAAFLFARRDRRIALANLQIAFGTTMTSAARRRIARQSFQTFALVVLDYFWFSRDTSARLRRYVHIPQDLREMSDSPGPRVFFTLHMANWEMMGLASALRGMILTSVAKPVKNPYVDRLVTALRVSTGQCVVTRKGALRGLMKALKSNGNVALVLDQDTVPEEGGVQVEFFGLPVTISDVAAVLATHFQAPIFGGYCQWTPDGHYHSFLRQLEAGDPATVTSRIAAQLEEEIRRNPGQWTWMYKRWKRRLPGSPTNAYPYYADFV